MLQGNLSILLSNEKEKQEDPQRDDLGQFKIARNKRVFYVHNTKIVTRRHSVP